MKDFPKGDARRLFKLLLAIEELDRPTTWTLAAHTGHNKGTILADVERLREQFGVEIEQDGAVFAVTSWGAILKKSAMKKFLQG